METKGLDVVYFVKDGPRNDELRYSIRSVSSNFSYNRLWVFGGCPRDIIPDVRVRVDQMGDTKWDKVRNMYKMLCDNKEITDDFILFNDDFFVMKPTDRIDTLYRCSLQEYIDMIERKNRGKPNGYTKLLRECDSELQRIGLPPGRRLSYELHTPFVFNKALLKSILQEWPTQHCTRSMYGNLYDIKGKQSNDIKIFDMHPTFDYKKSRFLSTDDSIVNVNNDIWRWIKGQFPHKSKYES